MFNKLLVGAAISIISVSAYAQCPANMEKGPYEICVVKRAVQQQQANIRDTKTTFIRQTQQPQNNGRQQFNGDSQFLMKYRGQ